MKIQNVPLFHHPRMRTGPGADTAL